MLHENLWRELAGKWYVNSCAITTYRSKHTALPPLNVLDCSEDPGRVGQLLRLKATPQSPHLEP